MIFPHIKDKQCSMFENPIIALDPGIRTFQAGYDSLGRFTEYGSGSIERVFAYGKKMDAMQSKIDKHHKDSYGDRKERIRFKNERRHLRKQFGFMRNKVQNWIQDVYTGRWRETSPRTMTTL